jgi:hypothetical protein
MDHTYNFLGNQVHLNVVEVASKDEQKPSHYFGLIKERPKVLFNSNILYLMTLFVPPEWQILPSSLDGTSVGVTKGSI